MKIAICGHGPLAMESALALSRIPADVTLFTHERPGGAILQLIETFPKHPLSHAWTGLQKNIDCHVYKRDYLDPLAKDCEKSQIIMRPYKVLRIQKCFLAPGERPPYGRRLGDLFKVVYEVNPEDSIKKYQADNPEHLAALGESTLSSLKEKNECFENFDIVIDANDLENNPLPLGPSHSYALNEKHLQADGILSYGIKDICRNWPEILKEQELVLVGSGKTAELVLIELKDWIKDKKNRLVLISSDPNPFQESSHPFVRKILSTSQENFEVAKEKFAEDLRSWQSREDYIRAKIQRPLEPIPQITLYAGSHITSLDKMINLKTLYATIERAGMRLGKKSHLQETLKTIPVKKIIVATGYKINEALYGGLEVEFLYSKKAAKNEFGLHPEPGLYTLTHSYKNGGDDFAAKKNKIEFIKKDILSFFTRIG